MKAHRIYENKWDDECLSTKDITADVERLLTIAKRIPGYDGYLHHEDLKELKEALKPFVEE